MSNELINPQDFWQNTNIDQTDFSIPRCTIGQKSTEKGKPGMFNFNNGTSVESMPKCTLIVPRKTRVLYGPTTGSPSRCGSDDFYQPAQRYDKPISQNCLSCFAAQWGDDPAKVALAKELNRQDPYKPLCSETYNLLLADQNGSPFFISFQKTQLKLVQEKLFSRLRHEFGRIPPYQVNFDMTLEKLTNANGQTYYSVVFDNFVATEDEYGTNLYMMFSKRAGDILAQQHQQMDDDKDEVPF